jgi:PqqD family protein of HPr-rel-A system
MAETHSNPRAWRVNPNHHLSWRTWDDEHVVYHRESGDTHLLNAVAAAALECLAESPATADDLTGHVAAHLGLEADEPLRSRMSQLLATFDDLGLIEPVDEGQRAAR